jgi:hypothetical protein
MSVDGFNDAQIFEPVFKHSCHKICNKHVLKHNIVTKFVKEAGFQVLDLKQNL